jgi:hypothetical protein
VESEEEEPVIDFVDDEGEGLVEGWMLWTCRDDDDDDDTAEEW